MHRISACVAGICKMHQQAVARVAFYRQNGEGPGFLEWAREIEWRTGQCLRRGVILEGANVPCELVRDWGG